MNVLIYKYNPDTIGLTNEIINKYNLKIITSEHLIKKYEDMGVNNVLFINKKEFNFSDIWNKINQLNKSDKIKNLCMLAEEEIEYSGIISDSYNLIKTPSMLSAYLYRDKYFMRSVLNGQVLQPKFRAINYKEELIEFFKEQNNPIIIKPRTLAGSKGVKIIKTIKELENLLIPLENYIVEEFINIKKMYTVDGICKDSKIIKFYIHEYDKPLAETLDEKDNGFYVRTSNLYNNIDSNKIIINKLFNSTKKVISALSNKSAVHPFHFEFFLDAEDNIIFCEAAARFGGANIPKLIELSYGIKISDIYFDLLFSDTDLPEIKDITEIEKPKKISCCYMPYRRKGRVKKIPNKEIFDWTYNTRIIVNENQEITNPTTIAEQLFITVFTSNDEENFKKNISKLKNIAINEFIII